jgi:hypothetical protein
MRTRVKRIWSHGAEAYQVEKYTDEEGYNLPAGFHWYFVDCYASAEVAKFVAKQLSETGIQPSDVVAEYGQ